ncbi:hypothetical protein OAG11_02055 [Verrucomicrobia bacterium]|nr:hypothetical protein [Verrucomicrobiota bacterium]
MKRSNASTRRFLHRLLEFILSVCILLPAVPLKALNIAHPSDASTVELQAAKEVRRYIFLRTGIAPEVMTANRYADLPGGDVIVVAADNKPIITELKSEYGNIDAPDSENRKGYLLKSINKNGRNVLVITGADTATTLTAAYRFAELIGCYFNLAGDVIPDQKLAYPLDISDYDEKSQPWFELRGNLPFHNFLAGPDFWSTADYKSFLTQQAKMGLNFFGLHHYPQRGEPSSIEGPEPHVWIGHKNDVNADGTIKEGGAYTTYWASTFRTSENSWSGTPVKTIHFSDGADTLFAHDEMASDAVGSKEPSTPAEKAAVINNVGFLLRDAFTHAKRLGIKTALGSESPLAFEPGNSQMIEEGEPAHIITEDWIRTCPPYVQDRMREVHGFSVPASRGADNEAFAKALYEGMFTRIMRTHPLDYFWVWTYEMWSYGGHVPSSDQIEAVADDYKYSQQVMTEMNTPFKLATFGWKVGSSGGDGDELEFHDDLPLEVPFGTLWDNAQGMWSVLPTGREGWSSCWYEEDWGLIQPQLRTLGVYNEIAHGIRHGGVQANIAKHWRIKSVSQASAAHAKLSWDNRAPVAGELLSLNNAVTRFPVFDLWETSIANQPPAFVRWITQHYQDWAKANFGSEKSDEIGALLAMADRLGEPKFTGEGIKGSIPRSSRFLPSALNELEDDDPTNTTDPRFLDAIHVYTQFCSYKDHIVGIGNRDRYMYWYHFFQGQIELCKMAIYRQRYVESDIEDSVMKKLIMKSWSNLMTHEIQRVRNVSELGVIAQLHQSTLTDIIRGELGITDPVDSTYKGENAVRAMPELSQINTDEPFEQKVIFLGKGEVSHPEMHYRKMGSSDPFTILSLVPMNSSSHVMKVTLANPGYDFEYFITGLIDGQGVTYPVTGGKSSKNINKTVVISLH